MCASAASVLSNTRFDRRRVVFFACTPGWWTSAVSQPDLDMMLPSATSEQLFCQQRSLLVVRASDPLSALSFSVQLATALNMDGQFLSCAGFLHNNVVGASH